MGDLQPHKGWYLRFGYNGRGYGPLSMHQDHISAQPTYIARTGYITREGRLYKAIPSGIWTGREAPEPTTEPGMAIVDGQGWKWRLWTPEGAWSHFLVHPDGGLPGTKGCIGIQGTDAIGLYRMLSLIMRRQPVVPVYINTQPPEDGAWTEE